MFPEKHSTSKWSPELSGKVMVLDTMLAMLKATTTDKIVLVSNYTQVCISCAGSVERELRPPPLTAAHAHAASLLDAGPL